MSFRLAPIGRFAAVGLVCTALHVGVASALITRMGSPAWLGNAIAFLVANAFSYYANTFWTFAAKPQVENLARFVLVSVAALFMTATLAWAVELMGGQYLAGVGLIVTVVPVFTYFAHHLYTYGSLE